MFDFLSEDSYLNQNSYYGDRNSNLPLFMEANCSTIQMLGASVRQNDAIMELITLSKFEQDAAIVASVAKASADRQREAGIISTDITVDSMIVLGRVISSTNVVSDEMYTRLSKISSVEEDPIIMAKDNLGQKIKANLVLIIERIRVALSRLVMDWSHTVTEYFKDIDDLKDSVKKYAEKDKKDKVDKYIDETTLNILNSRFPFYGHAHMGVFSDSGFVEYLTEVTSRKAFDLKPKDIVTNPEKWVGPDLLSYIEEVKLLAHVNTNTTHSDDKNKFVKVIPYAMNKDKVLCVIVKEKSIETTTVKVVTPDLPSNAPYIETISSTYQKAVSMSKDIKTQLSSGYKTVYDDLMKMVDAQKESDSINGLPTSLAGKYLHVYLNWVGANRDALSNTLKVIHSVV